jgi:pimeloyl-ACP methyl ester carboxylesterase
MRPETFTLHIAESKLEDLRERLIRTPPRSFAERTYSNIKRWTIKERGGHFAAMEQPDALAEDIRTFFHELGTAAGATTHH